MKYNANQTIMTDENQSLPPPDALLMELVHGYMVSKALQAAAEIGIADLLAGSPKTAEELARATSTNPSALFRALAGRGIFRQNESGCFENTALSEPMRSDSPIPFATTSPILRTTAISGPGCVLCPYWKRASPHSWRRMAAICGNISAGARTPASNSTVR